MSMYIWGASSISIPQSPAVGLIPMFWADPRFANNVAGPPGGPTSDVSNLDWNENPGYANGNQVWDAGNFKCFQCRVDWREGPRIGSGLATDLFTWEQSYNNCVGNTGDHADAFQAFVGIGGGQATNLKVINSFIRAYTDAEAASVYGAGFVGSTGLFWSDDSVGTVTFQNVVVKGGDRMVTIDNPQPSGFTIHVNFDHVYFVNSPGFSPTFWEIRIGFPTNAQNSTYHGTVIIDNWTNVFDATIVNNVIIPGAAIPFPGLGNSYP